MSLPLRTALIGFGLGGRSFHAPFLMADPSYRLDVVVTGDQERARAASRETSAEVLAAPELLWDRELDLVVISTGNAAHAALAERALDHGLHTVVDKPLCGDAATGRELAERARAAGRIVVAYQNRRWDDDFLTLQALIGSGHLGEVHRVESRFERWRPRLSGGWRESADPADLPGVLFDLGSHVLDQALLLLGPAVSVHAELAARRAGAAADDDAFVAITHASGAVSHSWMSLVAAASGPRFRALGSAGGFEISGTDPQEAVLRGSPVGSVREGRLIDHEGSSHVVNCERGDYGRFWSGLHRCLREGEPSPVPIEQTLALLDVIDAARESARTGRTVSVIAGPA